MGACIARKLSPSMIPSGWSLVLVCHRKYRTAADIAIRHARLRSAADRRAVNRSIWSDREGRVGSVAVGTSCERVQDALFPGITVSQRTLQLVNHAARVVGDSAADGRSEQVAESVDDYAAVRQ